jgi:hypothetical protein
MAMASASWNHHTAVATIIRPMATAGTDFRPFRYRLTKCG